MRHLSATPFIAVAALALSCGGSSTSPSATPTSSASGVTLSGSFSGGGSASSLGYRAQATSVDDLVVVVLDAAGTEVARVDVVGGRFTLRGLPDGAFTVRFLDGSAVVGEERFEAIKVNQQITLTLDLRNGEVRVIEERRNGIPHGGIEIEGRISGLRIFGDPMTGELEVDGFTIVTRAAETAIRKGNRALTLEDLRDGDRVHVKGEFEAAANGTSQVFAREIKLQEEERDDAPPASSCSFADPAKPGKILICHKGKTLSVSSDAWSGHAGHGDTCGPCS